LELLIARTSMKARPGVGEKQMRIAASLLEAAKTLTRLGRLVAAIRGTVMKDPELAATFVALETLSRNEAIPPAIVGGMGAFHHGYERFTNDVDVVVPVKGLGRPLVSPPPHLVRLHCLLTHP
jgi:hypothetical protein